ncbi:hypothetical protein KEM55_000140 [Ascosphaera atra]|nr:hypothetical protein KEM55_000140 [Ascosphaera atra]
MQQLDHPGFPYVCSWFAKEASPALPCLYQQLEHYLGIKCLWAQAEIELDDIQQKTNESVSASFHRIKLRWDRAGTPEDVRFRMFARKLHSDLVDSLKGFLIAHGDCKDLSSLLEAARSVEGIQMDIDALHKCKTSFALKKQYSASANSAFLSSSKDQGQSRPRDDNHNTRFVPTVSMPSA